jgi:hypothetical protein
VGLALTIRYRWDSGTAEAYWDGAERSPVLSIEANGSRLFSLSPLKPREWTALDSDEAASLRRVLETTSFLTVLATEEEPATILVQEEGMAHKPSILLNLTVADILRCWASLTPEQRAILLEERYQELAGMASALMPHVPLAGLDVPSIFDAFAGIFHAFGCLERSVSKALAEGREKEAVYLLFGRKYDSLPQLLKRVVDEEKDMDHVRRYVILLCARQIVDRVRAEATADFRNAHRQEFRDLDARIEKVREVREALAFGSPAEREQFLEWFEAWFLRRAVASEASQA